MSTFNIFRAEQSYSDALVDLENVSAIQSDLIEADEDIRDVESGETYFAIADPDRGGRLVLTGMFIAIWRTRKAAKNARGRDSLVVVRCLKP